MSDGPEVVYNSDDFDVRRLSDDTSNGYDMKIKSRPGGGYAAFETTTNWERHSHLEKNANDETTYERGEFDGDAHSWRERQHLIEVLEILSTDELELFRSCISYDCTNIDDEEIFENNQRLNSKILIKR